MNAGDSAFLGALYWLQESALGVWVTESSWALFFFLIVHTISMGFLAGTGTAVSLRVLGVARRAPLSRFTAFLGFMKACLFLAVLSGVFLVVGYPAKALTNPVFYAKLTLVAVALALTGLMSRQLMRLPAFDLGPIPAWAKAVALAAIAAWLLAITAGRFLAYTQRVTILLP